MGLEEVSFFNGSDEVLIKVVLESIHTYLMSSFKLPISLCNELRSIVLNFWWGSSSSKQKIAWWSWDKVCLPKCLGGIGFRDLHIFNQALLAKWAWRLITERNSLAFQVFKDKYFRNNDLLLVVQLNGSSYLWQSLLWGWEIFKIRLNWCIEDGSKISSFLDSWLPRPPSFTLIMVEGAQNLKV